MNSQPLPLRKMLISGQWVSAKCGESIAVEDPARRHIIAKVPRGRVEDVDTAVEAAFAAFDSWKLVPARERGRALDRIADDLESRCEEIARLIAEETGNALRTQARPEVKISIEMFRYFGGLASELKGETLPLAHDLLSYTVREPLGVVAAVIPWNAPFLLASVKIAPALSAGNTMVMKTAEDAPLAILTLAEICAKHTSAGVLNVLTGTSIECGAPLLNHPKVSKLTFTGSTAVGRLVMEAAAKRILPVSMELRGKSPSIVFPDAVDDWVIDGIVAAMRFTRQSQSCTAGSRLFVHERIYDSVLERLCAAASKLKSVTRCPKASTSEQLSTAANLKSLRLHSQWNRAAWLDASDRRSAGSSRRLRLLPQPHRLRPSRQ
ncbi:aldehyde dehydrogenase family protein [Bradyrhizobium sp. LMG 9283]|uniref:aldehyde dehydrogenase family protein n=1 Tax=Bradyrhizobium sp. LMG 9283 TaxID=592064 RepID=UPI00388E5DCA